MHAKPFLGLAAAALAWATWAAAAATVQVEFVKPESFTDAGRRNARVDREENLGAIREHLVKQAAQRLPADQSLAVSVTDVDLAGSFEPWQRYSGEIRVVKDIYPPRIDLHFRLARADGSVVKEGDRSLRDPGFMMGATSYPGDNLKYEKKMLDQWMAKEFE